MATQELMLPQNIEAERGVLGSLIIDPDAIAQVADFLRGEDFYRDAHRTIYATIMHLYEQRIPSDFITISDELERHHQLDAIGGPGYIGSLINHIPTSGNIAYYARIVQKCAVKRSLAHASGKIAALAYSSDVDAEEAMGQAEQELRDIGGQQGQQDFSCDRDVLDIVMQKMLSARGQYGALTGVPTGLSDLDRALCGLQRSDLIILAARPAVGKSSLAQSITHHVMVKEVLNIVVFSLEMSKEQFMQRLLSMDAHVDLQRLRSGWIEDDEWEGLMASHERLSTNRLWIDDTASISVTAMYSKLRRLLTKQSIDLIIVDYLQLMTVVGTSGDNRVQQIAEITRNLKAIAKEFNVPVLALAQLSRATDNRQSKIPQMSDLRESGSIENDADVVLFIYRDEVYNPDSERKGVADIIIAKHRNGPTGEITVKFNGQYTQFCNLEMYPPEEVME